LLYHTITDGYERTAAGTLGGKAMNETTYEHIVVDSNGVAWIENANIKVIELVLERLARASSPEHIQAEHPTLSLGEIYSAFAYYEDHKVELDADIERRHQLVAEIQQNTPSPPVQSRLARIKRGM
jgi:uncharacterized protein (DUF433 family)